MAPLAQILALLATAVATVDIKVVPLDMAQNSFDDQYLKCSNNMTESLPELQRSDFDKNSWFADIWRKATKEWQNKNTPSSPLTPEQAIAIIVYSTLQRYSFELFNWDVRVAGSSNQRYRDEFHYKSLHFLLTRAVQTLRCPNDCQDVFWEIRDKHFEARQGDEVRFGQFASTSLSKTETQNFEVGTIFKVHTCHGVNIEKFYRFPRVVIPPFETFMVTAVGRDRNIKKIDLRSRRTFSNYDCEWLKGGSLPRNSPNLWGFLLVTMAMAAVSGTL